MTQQFSTIQGDLCVSVEALTSLLSLDTVKNGLRINRQGSPSWRHYTDPADARRRWIVYDTIPTASRARIDSHYGDIWSAYYTDLLTTKLEQFRDVADITFFITNCFHNAECEQLAESCMWLRLLASQTGLEHFSSKQEYYTRVCDLLRPRKLAGLRVSNWRVLDRKVKAWTSTGRDSLITRKKGNTNSTKISEAGINFIISCYASPLKPTVRKVAELYNSAAKDKGWAIISEERVRQIIREPHHQQMVASHRHGLAAARNQFERTIKRRRPSFPDALWSLDGMTIQLRYQEFGKVRSDLYSIIIHDVHSDKIIGSAEGTTETSTLVQAALRAASRNTMMLPLQLQYDNSSANTSAEVKDLMTRLSDVAFPTAPYNGKAKPIESLIGRLEGLNLRYYDNFKGGNITSHSLQIKANPDHLNSIDLPTRDQAIAQFRLAIQVHNNTPSKHDGLTPEQKYAVKHDQRRPIDDILFFVHTFWVERRNTARYTKDGLTIEVNKVRYTYEVESAKGIEDMEFRRQWLGTDFTIKYDPDDLDMIALYRDGVHITLASRKYEAPMAMIDRFDGEGQIIKEQLQERKRYLREQEEDLAEIQESVRNEGLPVELDHRQLNKDAYNRLEGEMLDDLIEKSTVKPAIQNKIKRDRSAPAPVSLFNGDDEDGSVLIDSFNSNISK